MYEPEPYSTRERQVIAVLLALAIVGGALTAAVGDVRATETVTIDADHRLDSEDAIDDFETDGVATARGVGGLDLSLTVAEDHEDVGLDGPYTDFDSTYLRIQYNESMTRDLRIYLPEEYMYPRLKKGLDAENADVSADFEPVENSSYMAVEVTLEGQTDAVFQLQKAAGAVFYARESGQSWVENRTGLDLPSIGTDTEWQYVDSSVWVNNSTTARIEHPDPTVQFDGSDGDGDNDTDSASETWLPVPDCDSSKAQDAPACTFSKDGEENVTYVLARDPPEEMPTLRYATDSGPLTGLGGVVNDLLEAPSRIMDQLQNILPGGE